MRTIVFNYIAACCEENQLSIGVVTLAVTEYLITIQVWYITSPFAIHIRVEFGVIIDFRKLFIVQEIILIS